MTFARLAKLAAVLLVALALWQMRAPAPPPRIVVFAVPGAAADVVPALDGEIGAGEIRSPAITTGGSWWHRFFAWTGRSDSALLWEGEGAAARPLAVPARLLSPREEAEVVENDFLGSSAGAVVEAADITSGRLPSPYDRAIDAVGAAAASLPRDQWSEWIPVAAVPGAGADSPPAAEFQFTHHTDSTYFFSPAYVLGTREVVALPFLRGLDRSLRPLVSTHVIELARRRLADSEELFRDGGESTAVIAFSSAVEAAVDVFAPDSIPAAVLERAGDAVSADLASFRKAVGADGLVLVLGGPPTTRQAVGSAWYRLVRGGVGATVTELPSSVPIDFDAARAMMRYLLGISLEESERNRLPADLVARFPIPATIRPVQRDAGQRPPAQPWSVDGLESVPGALD